MGATSHPSGGGKTGSHGKTGLRWLASGSLTAPGTKPEPAGAGKARALASYRPGFKSQLCFLAV